MISMAGNDKDSEPAGINICQSDEQTKYRGNCEEVLKLSWVNEVIGQVTSGAHQSLFAYQCPHWQEADASQPGVLGALPFFDPLDPELVCPVPPLSGENFMARKLIVSILVMALTIVAVLLIMRVLATKFSSD